MLSIFRAAAVAPKTKVAALQSAKWLADLDGHLCFVFVAIRHRRDLLSVSALRASLVGTTNDRAMLRARKAKAAPKRPSFHARSMQRPLTLLFSGRQEAATPSAMDGSRRCSEDPCGGLYRQQ